MAGWWTDLDALYDEIWRRLERGVADSTAPARHPVLASTGVEGGGEARVVVLRAASREASVLEVHTDSASAKVGELAREPRATLLVWDPEARLQIRLRAHVEIMKGAGAERVWSRIPEAARAVYGGSPRPGMAIETPEVTTGQGDPARFAVLTARVSDIDSLHLGDDRHRRALFRGEDNWRGSWRMP